jgi:hypothetical protein
MSAVSSLAPHSEFSSSRVIANDNGYSPRC